MSGEQNVDVIIIGTGFGGVGMASALERYGRGSYVVLEKQSTLGGTWRENTYPGAACDVKATLYHYSFAPWTWSRAYPAQPEILRYLNDTADLFGVTPHVRFGEDVTSARWEEATSRWVVRTARGSTYVGRHLVSATGQLSRPHIPAIEGASTFGGEQFHTAQWRHDVALAGKRVAVIGSGASAIQVVPAIAPEVGELTVFQRSAPYVMPKEDPITTAAQRWRQRWFPRTTTWSRLRAYLYGELFGSGLVGKTAVRTKARAQWELYVSAVVRDPALRSKIEPDYEIGCKRVLLASDWYSTLQQSNVQLETNAISRITTDGVLTSDGVTHHADVIIWATGFDTTNFLAPMELYGVGGVSLRDVWRERPMAHRGVSVPAFPNFHILYGPNTNLGSNSIIFMLESQIDYVVQLMRLGEDQRWAATAVTDEAFSRWRDFIDAASSTTAWVQGCSSWYTKDGVNTNNWPQSSWRYHRLLRDVDVRDFHEPASTAVPA